MADVLLDLTLLGAIDIRNLCAACYRPRSEHTGILMACPTRQYPKPGEQLYLDDAPGPHQGATPE